MQRLAMLLVLLSLGMLSLSAGCTPDPGVEPTPDPTVAPEDPHVTTDVLDDEAPEVEDEADDVEEPDEDSADADTEEGADETED